MILDLLDLWSVVDGAARARQDDFTRYTRRVVLKRLGSTRVLITLELKDRQPGATCTKECWNKLSAGMEAETKGVSVTLSKKYSRVQYSPRHRAPNKRPTILHTMNPLELTRT